MSAVEVLGRIGPEGPSVLVLYTGGTIGMGPGPDGALVPLDLRSVGVHLPFLRRLPVALTVATFVDPIDSVRASKKIHDTFHPARTDTPIRLRISLNTGPCIAVRLNANADFFGGTVNVAAKLQAMAEGYQIAMSEATYRAPGVAEFLAEQTADLDLLEYTSKALPAPVVVRRWSVYRE